MRPSAAARRRRAGWVVAVGLAWALPSLAGPADGAGVSLALDPVEASVGEPLELTLTVELPSGVRLQAEPLGPELGPFRVLSGDWEPASPRKPEGEILVWRGRIAAYRTGELELPEFVLRVESEEGEESLRAGPRSVTIVSVLDGEGDRELADLKPPAGIAAEYGMWVKALVGLLLLVLVTLVLAWLQRRFASRLAARDLPEDPFRRMAPDVWAYAELQRLLEDGEQGAEAFHDRLAWIVKRYLGGRYRIELLERTTAEVSEALAQAGVPETAAQSSGELLERCDRVKFARYAPDREVCRGELDAAYRIVDGTRPRREEGAA